MEVTAALIVGIICTVVSLAALRFVSDVVERSELTRLFLIAFSIRIVFTIICYSTGIVSLMGGADDLGWRGFWDRSVHWHATEILPLWSIYKPDVLVTNPGFAYFGSLFYYVLGMRSQVALAVFNGFLNSLTVILIYKFSREFFSRKASSFAAWAAVFMPSFLIWSVLTIKETWLILFEIAMCYEAYLLHRRKGSRRLIHLALAILFIALTLALRFYVAWFLIAGVAISLACYSSRRPVRAAFMSTFGVIAVFFLLNQLQLVTFDIVSISQAQVAELSRYRESISDARFGGASSVRLPFDTTTLSGAILMLIAGSLYVLLSPFPWQIFNGRQIFTLPDVILWWYLVFVYIIPGIQFAYKRKPALLMSLFGFIVPLLLFYGMMFGNIGLAYRQRAQLMPFFLVIVAAGYERRLSKNGEKNLGKLLRQMARATN